MGVGWTWHLKRLRESSLELQDPSTFKFCSFEVSSTKELQGLILIKLSVNFNLFP